MERFVWIDETATYLHMKRTYARSKRGQRAHCKHRGRPQRYSLVVAMTSQKILTKRLIRGGMKRRDWLAFLEEDLLPKLKGIWFIQMDNLKLHKDDEGLDIIKENGHAVFFQPPYSPESNPIEEAFSKLKESLRSQGAKKLAELRRAVAHAITSITFDDISNWIAHTFSMVLKW